MYVCYCCPVVPTTYYVHTCNMVLTIAGYFQNATLQTNRTNREFSPSLATFPSSFLIFLLFRPLSSSSRPVMCSRTHLAKFNNFLQRHQITNSLLLATTMDYEVQDSGFRVQSPGFRIQGRFVSVCVGANFPKNAYRSLYMCACVCVCVCF